MKARRRFRRAGAALLSAGLALSPGPSAGAEPASDPVRVKVMIAPFLSYAALFVAAEEGYFAAQGLEVEFVTMYRSASAIPALIQGSIDVLPGTIMPAYLNAMARGGTLKIVAGKGYYASSGCVYSGLVARRPLVEQGVLDDPDNLKGLLVSADRTSVTYYHISSMLRSRGLTRADIEPTDVPYPAKARAFETGVLDITTASEPWLTRILAEENALLWMRIGDLLPDFQHGFILYGPNLLSADRAAGERFLIAYLQGVRRLAEGKTPRNLEILSKHTGLDAELLERACWPHQHLDGRVITSSLRQYQAWALEEDLVDEEVPIDGMWDPHIIEAARRAVDGTSR